jgi:hypothetical protein
MEMLPLILLLVFLNYCSSINNEIYDGVTSESLFRTHSDLNVIENEMGPDMTLGIVSHCTVVLENSNYTEKETAIRKFIEEEYNGTWLVVVDRNFTHYDNLEHVTGLYIKFSYKNHMVLIMRLVLNSYFCNYSNFLINFHLDDLRFSL